MVEKNPLVIFFREEEADWGHNGDHHNWSPERSAIELIRHLRAKLRPAPAAPAPTDEELEADAIQNEYNELREELRAALARVPAAPEYARSWLQVVARVCRGMSVPESQAEAENHHPLKENTTMGYDEATRALATLMHFKSDDAETEKLRKAALQNALRVLGEPTKGMTTTDRGDSHSAEVAWLIEDGTPGGRYYGGVGEHAGAWTTDHMRAIRYARREDAERAVMGLPNGWHLIGRAVEHTWVAAAAQPGERERGRPAIGMEQLERTTAAFHGRTVASWREFGEAYRAEEMAKMLRAIGAFRAAAPPGQEDEK